MASILEEEFLKKVWNLGFKDRGLGHGDYVVLCGTELIIECGSKNLAEHIINLHNRSLIENEVELAKDVIKPVIMEIIAEWRNKICFQTWSYKTY